MYWQLRMNYNDELFSYEINENNFDFSQIEWFKCKPSKLHNVIVIKFILAKKVQFPSQEILNDIGARLTEENGRINGIFLYAEQSGITYNLSSFSNKIPAITNFEANKLRGVIIVLRVHYSNGSFYLMIRNTQSQQYKNLAGLVNSEETHESAVMRVLQTKFEIGSLKLKVREIGTSQHSNYPFFHGKWQVEDKIFLVDIECIYINQMNSILQENLSQNRIFVEANNYGVGVIKLFRSVDFNNDVDLKQLVRRDSYFSDANDEFYGKVVVFLNIKQFADLHFDIIKFIDQSSNETLLNKYDHRGEISEISLNNRI